MIIKASEYRITTIYISLNLAICNLCFAIFGQIPPVFIIAKKCLVSFKSLSTELEACFFNNQNVLLVLFHIIDISILDIQTVASKYLLQKDSDNWSCYA